MKDDEVNVGVILGGRGVLQVLVCLLGIAEGSKGDDEAGICL